MDLQTRAAAPTRRTAVQHGLLAGLGFGLRFGLRAAAGASFVGGASRAAPALDLPRPGQLKNLSGGGIETAGPGSLRAHAEARGLLVGCAVNSGLLQTQPAYGRVLAEQFNLVVGENCMKWGQIHPSPDTYDFKEADALVDFAEKHGMKVRGHNLCWHENLPAWFATTVTKDNARQILTDHIGAVAGRYKGRIQSWDVVNEAIDLKDGRPDGLRVHPWLDLLGPDYIEIAFRAAHLADPAAVLTYNDFGVEYDTTDEQAKRAAMGNLIDQLVKNSVPIGAVGIQSHLRTGDIARLGDGLRDFIKKLGKRGLAVYLSELDVNDDGLADEDVTQQDRDVAAVYHHYLEEMLKDRTVKEILTWGVADQQSWLQAQKSRTKHPDRAQRPLLLSENDGVYTAKPAFYAVRSAIDGAKRR